MRGGYYASGEPAPGRQVNPQDWARCATCQHPRIDHVRSRGRCGIAMGRPAQYRQPGGRILWGPVEHCPCRRNRVGAEKAG